MFTLKNIMALHVLKQIPSKFHAYSWMLFISIKNKT